MFFYLLQLTLTRISEFFGEKGCKIDAIEADEQILESDVAIFAKDDVKRNDDVDAHPTAARNCPITRSSWHISRPVSHFPSVTSLLLLPLLLSSLSFFFFILCTGMHANAWAGMARGAESKGDKIYKYVGGARDPFQCLFNQE